MSKTQTPETRWQPKPKPRYRARTGTKLNRRDKMMADYLLANPKAAQHEAYLATHITNNEHGARVDASRVLAKPSVMKYMAEHGDRALQDMIEVAEYSKELGKAGTREGASYAAVAVSANKDIADRAFGKATTRVELSSKSISVNIDLTGTTHVEPV